MKGIILAGGAGTRLYSLTMVTSNMIENREGIKISAPEEIAFRNSWITKDELFITAELYGKKFESCCRRESLLICTL